MSDHNEAVLNVAVEPAPAETSPPIRIEAVLTSRLNLAFHQNAVPVLRELVLINDGDAPLEAVELTLTSEPAFLTPKTWRIDAVPAGQRYHVPKLDVALDGTMLGRLTEAESATVTITSSRSGGADAPLARNERPLELLARNQWGGVGNIPEMIAAFVQPNDPAVERVLKKAADILRQNGKSGALNGYDGGPKRAWELAPPSGAPSARWASTTPCRRPASSMPGRRCAGRRRFWTPDWPPAWIRPFSSLRRWSIAG